MRVYMHMWQAGLPLQPSLAACTLSHPHLQAVAVLPLFMAPSAVIHTPQVLVESAQGREELQRCDVAAFLFDAQQPGARESWCWAGCFAMHHPRWCTTACS